MPPVGYLDGAALAVLAVALAEPVPRLLATRAWPIRAPRAALALWSSIGLAAGLSSVGSLLSIGLAPLDRHLLPALPLLTGRLLSGGGTLPAASWLMVWTGLALLCWQVLVLARCLVSVARHRQAHRELLDLVGSRHGSAQGEVVVLDDARRFAYHLPGLRRRSRIVVTRGCLGIARPQLAAVLAHERAHARGHHAALVGPFVAWERTFPFLVGAVRATAAVRLLTELLADDAAVAAVGAPATLDALQQVSAMPLDRGWTGDGALPTRARRLLAGRPGLGPTATAAAWTASGIVLLAPTAMLAAR